jgi:hypothetical protein
MVEVHFSSRHSRRFNFQQQEVFLYADGTRVAYEIIVGGDGVVKYAENCTELNRFSRSTPTTKRILEAFAIVSTMMFDLLQIEFDCAEYRERWWEIQTALEKFNSE